VSIELRESERLDASYVVTVRLVSAKQSDSAASMTNLSRGGLCFVSTLNLRQGDRVEIDLPSARPVATLKAKVIWCRPQRDRFSVGAEFVEMSDARRTRIIEMHRAICTYQKMNNVSGDTQQAAAEWLSLHAEKFLAGTS
jgi:hypothetical protein